MSACKATSKTSAARTTSTFAPKPFGFVATKALATTYDFAAQNVGNVVVLSTNQLDIKDQVGFRAIGRYDICPLSVVEFGYTGIYDYSDSATVTDPVPGNLFSLFSRTGARHRHYSV